MKVFFNILGIVCLPVGALWILQGFKVLRFAAMSGHRRWILIGGIVIIIGILILMINNRRKAKA